MNLDNQKLRAIQTTKAELKKQLEQTHDEHIRQKLEHQIHCLTMEENRILNEKYRLGDPIQ